MHKQVPTDFQIFLIQDKHLREVPLARPTPTLVAPAAAAAETVHRATLAKAAETAETAAQATVLLAIPDLLAEITPEVVEVAAAAAETLLEAEYPETAATAASGASGEDTICWS